MENILYHIGSSICHQLEERSFIIGGSPLPLCARCTGIYLGVLGSILYLWVRKKWTYNWISKKNGLCLGIALSIGLADSFTSYIGWRESNNVVRLLTGSMMGMAVPILMLIIYNTTKHHLKEKTKEALIQKLDFVYIFLLVILMEIIVLVILKRFWWIGSIIIICAYILFLILSFFVLVSSIIQQKYCRMKIFVSVCLSLSFILLFSHIHNRVLEKLSM